MAKIQGYPFSAGPKRIALITKAGPASCTAITPGSTPSGGQTVAAVDFGLKYIEYLQASVDGSGTYMVSCVPIGTDALPKSWLLQWKTSATGAALTNGDLSSYVVRLLAIGY
jgi:hypothetical protein